MVSNQRRWLARAAVAVALALGSVAAPRALRAEPRAAASAHATRPAVVMVGTFDPIHKGHLETARLARDTLGARVILVPLVHGSEGKHPLPLADRLKMARRAVRGIPGVEVADQKTIERFTRDRQRTLDELAGNAPVYMLYGSDAYQVSVERRGYVATDLAAGRRVAIVPRAGYAIPDHLPPGVEVIPAVKTMAVSSTQIRDALLKGRHPNGLPRSVESYIERRGLYQTPASVPPALHAE